ncbi:MAG TPA: hypothetical protein VL361_21015 [Candidatus Limnocylindrales bacterium]|jgi:hypothetical protein|nr:hypothetical protein [Candidatus Limnocylindrales bacterium]
MSTKSIESAATARWWTVTVFAIAMAWVEAAVVFYLRTMFNRMEPYQPNPLPEFANLGKTELVREAATLVMLLTIGMMIGSTWRKRLGYSAIAFGIWDIFYYLFLRVMCGWPHSLFDWDILFLLPLPWWGPVCAPISIAALMIIWGTLVNSEPEDTKPIGERRAWLMSWIGVLIALYVFMSDSIRALKHGEDAVRNVLPVSFNWPLFGVGFVLMAMPALVLLREFLVHSRLRPTPELAKIEPS